MFLPFFFLLCVAFGFTNGRNVYVEQGQGTDGYGTLSQPYGSITQAFENSRDGDIIMIETGVYTDFGLVMGSPLLEISFLYFDSGGHEPNCVIDLSSNTEGVPFLENHLSSANVTIDGLVFKNNPFGSIISFTDGVSLVIENAVFQDNNLATTSTTDFSHCISTEKTNLVINGCTFLNNFSPTFAAAIYSYQNSGIIQSSQFENNLVTYSGTAAPGHLGNGGAVTIQFDDPSRAPEVIDCIFQNNTANYGGALYIFSSPLETSSETFSVSNTSFLDNVARNIGGGVHSSGDLQLFNTTFSGNKASDGGALALQSGVSKTPQADITDSIFSNNTATKGGGVYIDTPVSVLISGSNFTDNQGTGDASRGGGIYILNATLFISQCHFTSNSAQEGGAVFVEQLEPTTLIMKSCYIGQNEADSGGGVMVGGPLYYFQILNTTFEQNEARTDSGGGLRMAGSGSVSRCTFLNNMATTGAGVSVSSAGLFILSESTFLANTASDSGGGLEVRDEVGGFITQTQFQDNVAGNHGGGVLVFRTVLPLEFLGCTWTNNTAQIEGHHAYIDGDLNSFVPLSTTFRGCVIFSQQNTISDIYGQNSTVIFESTCSLPRLAVQMNSSFAICGCNKPQVDTMFLQSGGVYTDGDLTLNELTWGGGIFSYVSPSNCVDGTLRFLVESESAADVMVYVSGDASIQSADSSIDFLSSYSLNWTVTQNGKATINGSHFHLHGDGVLTNDGTISLLSSGAIYLYSDIQMINAGTLSMEGGTYIRGNLIQEESGQLILEDTLSNPASVTGNFVVNGQTTVVPSEKMTIADTILVLGWANHSGLFSKFFMNTNAPNTTASPEYEEVGFYVKITKHDEYKSGDDVVGLVIVGIVVGIAVIGVLTAIWFSYFSKKKRDFETIQE